MRYLLLLLIFITFNTWADCDYRVTLSNMVVNIQESTQVVQVPYQIRRGKDGVGACDINRVYFSKGRANSYQRKAYNSVKGSSVDYNLHSNISMIGTLKQFGDAFQSNEFLQNSLPNRNQNYSNRFFISVPGTNSQDNADGGIYTDNVQISYYASYLYGLLFSLDTVETFTVTIIIPTKVSISVVDEGAVFDPSSTTKVLNFGYLSANQQKAADIRVVSNTPYRIQLSSLNNGNMKHSTSNSLINYQMRVNGSNVSLGSSQGSPVTIGTGDSTDSAGDRYNARFTIVSATDTKASGTYEDVITITAIAN